MLALMRYGAAVASPAGKHARLTILVYHRILLKHDPLVPWSITVEEFDQQMQVVRALFNLLPLGEAARRLKHGTLPSRPACITFDDGYADNESVALPVLKRHGLPATFFVATGYLDGGCMWNDRVVATVAQAKGKTLDLSSLELGAHAVSTLAERRATIERILAVLKYQPNARREESVKAMGRLVNTQPPPDLMMRTAQVRALSSAGMEIGAHTVTHPILTKLPLEKACEEIGDSKKRLEEIIRQPVRLFAYPNGKPGRDYGAEHVAAVKGLGFDAAVSTEWGVATLGTNRWQLPRFTPWDKGPARFAARCLLNYRNPARGVDTNGRETDEPVRHERRA